MASKRSAALARQRAHEALAVRRQQHLVREKANESDLTTYLLLEQQITDTEHHFRQALATLRRKQGEHLRQWHARGEKLADIAELTGKPLTELNRLVKASIGQGRTDSSPQHSAESP